MGSAQTRNPLKRVDLNFIFIIVWKIIPINQNFPNYKKEQKKTALIKSAVINLN